MNITIIIAKWNTPCNGSQYTMHFSPNSTTREVFFTLDECSDPAKCSYKILHKADVEETFLEHDGRQGHPTFEEQLAEIYKYSKAPEKSVTNQ